MKLLITLAPYIGVIVIIYLLFRHSGSSSDSNKPTVKFTNFMTAFAVAIGCFSLILSVQTQFKLDKQNRPQLTAYLTGIDFKHSPPAPLNIECIIFKLHVANGGNQDTQIVDCWFIPEGKTRNNSHQLFLEPKKLVIEPRRQEALIVKATSKNPISNETFLK